MDTGTGQDYLTKVLAMEMDILYKICLPLDMESLRNLEESSLGLWKIITESQIYRKKFNKENPFFLDCATTTTVDSTEEIDISPPVYADSPSHRLKVEKDLQRKRFLFIQQHMEEQYEQNIRVQNKQVSYEQNKQEQQAQSSREQSYTVQQKQSSYEQNKQEQQKRNSHEQNRHEQQKRNSHEQNKQEKQKQNSHEQNKQEIQKQNSHEHKQLSHEQQPQEQKIQISPEQQRQGEQNVYLKLFEERIKYKLLLIWLERLDYNWRNKRYYETEKLKKTDEDFDDYDNEEDYSLSTEIMILENSNAIVQSVSCDSPPVETTQTCIFFSSSLTIMQGSTAATSHQLDFVYSPSIRKFCEQDFQRLEVPPESFQKLPPCTWSIFPAKKRFLLCVPRDRRESTFVMPLHLPGSRHGKTQVVRMDPYPDADAPLIHYMDSDWDCRLASTSKEYVLLHELREMESPLGPRLQLVWQHQLPKTFPQTLITVMKLAYPYILVGINSGKCLIFHVEKGRVHTLHHGNDQGLSMEVTNIEVFQDKIIIATCAGWICVYDRHEILSERSQQYRRKPWICRIKVANIPRIICVALDDSSLVTVERDGINTNLVVRDFWNIRKRKAKKEAGTEPSGITVGKRGHETASHHSFRGEQEDGREKRRRIDAENSLQEKLLGRASENPCQETLEDRANENPRQEVLEDRANENPCQETLEDRANENPLQEVLEDRANENPRLEMLEDRGNDNPLQEVLEDLANEVEENEEDYDNFSADDDFYY